ncbi:ATP-dependent nuclease [Virgibacillus halodenitrificans]|uniref:ATP-dependent nuclease n=1 Tax=Virgibacillus halodenitrificans TaxID=1482 RepID=UPI00311F390B
MDKDFILIIEEPEVYLHPSLQRKMINALKKVSESNQVFISSHSSLVISQLYPNQLKSIKKQNGITTVMDYTPEDIINELGIQPGDIFQCTNVLFVEGPGDKQLVESIIKKLVENELVEQRTADNLKVLDVNGIKTMSFYATQEYLLQYIKLSKANISFGY